MLTDDEAHELLHRAADTIEVGPGEPLPSTPPRPRWPLLVAAATVLVLAVSGAVLSGNDDDQPAPSGPPQGEPVEKPEVLDPDQIPSVLGYDLGKARDLLEGTGLRVVVRKQPEPCAPPGVVTGTEPTLGARFEPGQTVRVFLTAPTDVLCLTGARETWDLLRFARGVATPPDLAKDVTLFVEGGEPVRISSELAADPATWTICRDDDCHSALAAIEKMATDTWNGRGRPYVSYDLDAQRCEPLAAPPSLQDAHVVRMWITVPVNVSASYPCPNLSVLLHLGADGVVEGVGLDLPADVPASDPLEPSEHQREVGDAFVAWARGEPTPPPFADEVELRLLDDAWTILTGEEAEERALWTLCSGLPEEDCEPNPLRVLDEYDGPVVQSRSLANRCPPAPRDLPGHLADTVDYELIRLDQPEAKSCDDAFAVELWITEDGLIRAVNLLP